MRTSLLLVMMLTGCDPFHTGFEDVESAQIYRAAVLSEVPSQVRRVMTWNTKFGAGRIDFFFDCHGNRGLMREPEVIANLEGLAAKISQIDPDVLLLQEVDTLSKRSAYVDMVQWLLDHTELNHGAYASQWRADYIFSDGIGKVDSGNAILSKWPLLEATRIALPLIGEQDALTRHFYLKRNILKAFVEPSQGGRLAVLNVHTAAYSTDGTKKKHIDRLFAELDALDTAGRVFVAGGDLNTVPPGTTQVKGFPDSVCEDERFDADGYGEELTWLEPLYERFGSAIPLVDYQADNAPFFSHTTDKDGFWNRKLDYLFTNGAFVAGSGLTHQDEASGGMETMPLSDHAPIGAEWAGAP